MKAAALLIGSVLATPYVLDYDLSAGAAIAFFAPHGCNAASATYEISVLAAAWVVPLLTRGIAGATGVPLGLPVMLAFYGLVLRRAALDVAIANRTHDWRKRDAICLVVFARNTDRIISRYCTAVGFSTFSSRPALATQRVRHHSLAALWRDKPIRPPAHYSDREKSRSQMYKLYSMQRSGNSYKVRLALALLNIPYEAIEIDILRGESRTPDFSREESERTGSAAGSRDGRYLAESNAILWYVAAGTPLSPEQRIERAEALQWMFFEQHALEPNIGAAYFWLSLVKGGRDLQTHALEDWMERGYAALQVMENHLKTHRLLRRRPAHRRRHRALWLHPCRRPLRLRPRHLPGDPRLAAPGRANAGLRADGLAAGPSQGRRPALPRAPEAAFRVNSRV